VIVPYPRRRQPWRWTPRRVGALGAGLLVLAGLSVGGVVAASLARAADCDTAAPPSAQVAAGRPPSALLTGHPVAAVAAGPDVVFVSLQAWVAGDPNGIEVMRRGPDGLRSISVIPLRSGPAGLAMSPDGRVLLAALSDGVAVLDARRAAAGDPSSLLGVVPTGGGSGTAQLVVAGGRYVLTADENANRVTVLDLPRIELGDLGPAAQVGSIEVDMGPAGLGLSPDGRYVYVVSQVQQPFLRLGPTDFLYGLLTYVGLPRRAGTLSVIDVRRIERDPGGAVIARLPAGCGPVRVAASPDGRTVWVTARRSNELLGFRTDQVLAGRASGPVARVPVAAAPQGLGLARDGRFALVAGSDRTQDAASGQTMSVVDTAAALAGRPALKRSVAVGGMPHEIDVTPDQRMAYVANNGTSTLTTVDLAGLLGS
jgi:DNA-binding beta-propeller fold protein YncE